MINLETATVTEIASYFSHEVNNMFFKPDTIAEEQRESKQMRDLDICWIKTLSSYTYRTDLRNEKSSVVGKQLAEIPFIAKKNKCLTTPKWKKLQRKWKWITEPYSRHFRGLYFIISCNPVTKGKPKHYSKLWGILFINSP